jgi:hypothetical protein
LLQKARSNRSAGQAKVLTLGRGRRAPAGGAKPPADAGKHVQGIARLERRLDQDDVRLLGPVLGIRLSVRLGVVALANFRKRSSSPGRPSASWTCFQRADPMP